MRVNNKRTRGFSTDPETDKLLNQGAERERTSTSAIMRKAIKEYEEKYNNPKTTENGRRLSDWEIEVLRLATEAVMSCPEETWPTEAQEVLKLLEERGKARAMAEK